MAALDDLLARIADPALRADIQREIAPLRGEQELGLVFEKHLPERVRLYGHPVRRGLNVEFRNDDESATWQVTKVVGHIASLRRMDEDGKTVLAEESPVADLVVVRDFGDPIYPGLESLGRVERGGDKPFHAVINAENYHALETLLYTHEGKVDCIYIDPPYNSGARDWRYNNDYVDANDRNRHSKWLSFMEKRLELARRLLHRQGVLIVAIDENEQARLGVLLEQSFPGRLIQMVTVVTNPKGNPGDGLSRVEEYLYYVLPEGFVAYGRGDDLLTPGTTDEDESLIEAGGKPRWQGLLNSGQASARSDRPKMFYPVLIDENRGAVVGAGEPLLDQEVEPDLAAKVDGLTAVWPVRSDGTWGRWYVSNTTLRNLIEQGYVSLGAYDAKRKTWALSYAFRKVQQQVQAGIIEVTERDEQRNVVEMRYAQVGTRQIKRVWHRSRHDAGAYGSDVVKELTGRSFPFPKSLYAVYDALYPVIADKPEALVVDFFAGSGTTMHAVALLNATDSGRRSSILVTNNEVSATERQALTDSGHAPGDPEWESSGIFEALTRPRVTAAVTGARADGTPLKGRYIVGDPYSNGLGENVEFFRLTYEDQDRVQLGAAFAAVAPLLWLRAGGQGARVDQVNPVGWEVPEGGRYGVLFKADRWPEFVAAVDSSESAELAFIVTDSDAVFQQVVGELPAGVEPVRLYESYLTSFAINTGGAL